MFNIPSTCALKLYSLTWTLALLSRKPPNMTDLTHLKIVPFQVSNHYGSHQTLTWKFTRKKNQTQRRKRSEWETCPPLSSLSPSPILSSSFPRGDAAAMAVVPAVPGHPPRAHAGGQLRHPLGPRRHRRPGRHPLLRPRTPPPPPAPRQESSRGSQSPICSTFRWSEDWILLWCVDAASLGCCYSRSSSLAGSLEVEDNLAKVGF